MNIFNVVLTGGQVSGKTTILPFLKEQLETRGYVVLLVPEAASLVLSIGLNPLRMDPKFTATFQARLMGVQLALEHAAREFANLVGDTKEVVLLYDRGMADGRAYSTEKQFQEAIDAHEEFDYDGFENICSDCYDLVVHMETVAKKEGNDYEQNRGNNNARIGDRKWAVESDDKLIKAWDFMEQNHVIVKNYGDWEFKKHQVLEQILKKIKANDGFELERKWIVEKYNIPPNAKVDLITQTYLQTNGVYTERVRQIKSMFGGTYFTHTKKSSPISSGCREETEREITSEEYHELLKRAHPDRDPISKQRITFNHKGQIFELDVFDNGFALLELEVQDLTQPVIMPPDDVVKIKQEVTDNFNYTNFMLAQKKVSECQ